jgi:dTMP kinase
MSGRAKIKAYEAGMDLGLAADRASSFRIFQGRILDEYARICGEYGMTEVDATLSIGEQQRIMREMIDETLADWQLPRDAAVAAPASAANLASPHREFA